MSARYQQPEAITWQWGYIPAAASSIGFTLLVAALLALLAGLCCKLPKVLSVVSRLALTAALAVGLCLNGGYLRGVVRTHHAENLAAYQFFVRTIEAGLADAVQSDDLILCNENVWDSNAEAESAFFSRFTGRALHAQVLWTENPATDGDAYAYQTYRNYGGYDLAWCGRLQSADSDLMDGVQVYVQSAYVPDNAVIKYKVRLADGTEEARAICLLDCTQTPRDRNGDYLATVDGHVHRERQAHDLGRLINCEGAPDETLYCLLPRNRLLRAAGCRAGRCLRAGSRLFAHRISWR